jgi:hypothetical protein
MGANKRFSTQSSNRIRIVASLTTFVLIIVVLRVSIPGVVKGICLIILAAINCIIFVNVIRFHSRAIEEFRKRNPNLW